MITLPWQIAAAFIALFAVYMILNYLRRSDCDERVEMAKRDQHRETMHSYRDGYKRGLSHSLGDAKELKNEKDKDA